MVKAVDHPSHPPFQGREGDVESHMQSLLALMLLVGNASAATPEQAATQAGRAFAHGARVKLPKPASLKELNADIRAIAAELEATETRQLNAQDVSNILVKKVQEMKASGKYTHDLDPVFDRLEGMYNAIPNRYYAAYSPRQAMLSSVRQLEFDAERAADSPDLLGRLRTSLVFPMNPEDPSSTKLLPTGMTLKQYMDKGPILIFIMKHRLAIPQTYAEMTEEELVAKVKSGEPILGTGVLVRSEVISADSAFDLDKCWNLRVIHNEITPETWLFRGLRPPKPGQKVEIKGWVYYDSFHADEEEGELNADFDNKRPTVVEIHPVTKVTVLQ